MKTADKREILDAIEMVARSLNEHIITTDRRFDRIDERFEEVAQQFLEVKRSSQEIITAVNRTNARLADHELRIETLETKI